MKKLHKPIKNKDYRLVNLFKNENCSGNNGNCTIGNDNCHCSSC